MLNSRLIPFAAHSPAFGERCQQHARVGIGAGQMGDSNGTATLGSTTTTGWGVERQCFRRSSIGCAWLPPAYLIIGPSGPGGVYTNANGSIAGNGPHNPFINGTATFSLMIVGLLATDSVTSPLFSLARHQVPVWLRPHSTPGRSPALRHRHGRVGSAWLAQETEDVSRANGYFVCHVRV